MPDNVEGRRLAVGFKDALEPETHAGLWHDRFAPVLRPKAENFLAQAASHLDEVCKRHASKGYARAYDARVAMLHAHQGDVEGAETALFEAVVVGRRVVGLGAASVLEHQIALEHTWGVPVIPGSGLKGLASSTAHRYGGDRWLRAETDKPGGVDHQTLFGDTTRAGLVTFHDAWWKPAGSQLPLDLDVMTVHHREYYGDGTSAPADSDDPNPVSFITAHGTYLVALTGPETWVKCAAEWLQIGLDREGIGAKTRAGYGRMRLDPNAPLQSAQQCAAMARKAAVDTFKKTVAGSGFNGPGIQGVIRAAKTAKELGVSNEDIRTAVQAYMIHDTCGALRGWVMAPERSSEDRSAIAEFGLRPAAVAATAETWTAARVRVTNDKQKRDVVEVGHLPGSQRQAKDVKCDDHSLATMKEKRDSWFDAEVIIEKKTKLKAIRNAKPAR